MKKNKIIRIYLILLLAILVILYSLVKLQIIKEPGVRPSQTTQNQTTAVTSPELDKPTDGLPGPRPN